MNISTVGNYVFYVKMHLTYLFITLVGCELVPREKITSSTTTTTTTTEAGKVETRKIEGKI